MDPIHPLNPGPCAVSALGVWWSRHWGNPLAISWGASYFGAMTEQHILTEVQIHVLR